MAAAESSGAVLAVVNNLYGYGEVSGPITDDTPLAATHPKLRLRADMWRDALAAHEAGRIRVTEVRGSDYLEAWTVREIWYFGGPDPDYPVDITDLFDRKLAALRAHVTQTSWLPAPGAPPRTAHRAPPMIDSRN